MQPLSLTPKEDWAVSKAKPDNMVLAGTSWPGKTLYWWKMCFSFPLLLQVLTQERKGWSSFAGLNQALRRQKAKMRKVKSSKEMIPCITPSTSMTLGGFSVLQWLQAAGPLDITRLSGAGTVVSGSGSMPTALSICLSNLSSYLWHLSFICATISISCGGLSPFLTD